jgi:cytochrome b6-f complex iron-sulfur subunit
MTPLVRTVAGLAGGWIAARGFGLLSRLQQSGGHTTSRTRKLHSRRAFTRNAALAGSLVVLAEIAGGFVFLLWPNKTGAFGGDITVSAASVPEPEAEPYRDTQGRFFLVNIPDDGVQALYWKCVHLGCTVPWVEGEQRFHCPCHGSIYTYNGNREAGPAARALDAMPVTVDDNGNVTVNTNPGSLIVRNQYQPEHATPYGA